ncbi:probable rRNA-processing protein EBP2 homolog [Cryptomeria japonica]|uniref:probable rRNA-processing protein EBP2 homolog n=1 Tax=Cryptomeria japonica TaxID=3369 RepID=UPI0027DAAEE9|nr:probable rRNA-processing protein EBP2 homolog [Cryptomeria japonica]XP_057854126.2 probable rRNA-processing protein EBP2 homolog [Cryptomeria japonica]XP_057854127.2 probable rRNA-processing protein EBP2 homolog [Cryptomeria japonica]
MAIFKEQALNSAKHEELVAAVEEDDNYSEDEEEDSQDSEGEEDAPLSEPRKDAVYNTVGLHDKLEEIGWPDNVNWIDKLCVEYKREGEIDANDDLAREMAFYTQALEGTRQAYNKLQAMGIPFLRPEDYYAEMVKTDNHMLKVKDKLLFQKQKIEEAEERRKSREAKKLSKAVQAAKLKERAKKKKEDFESVKKWRKMRQNSGFKDGDDEMPLDFEEGKSSFQKGKKMRPGVSPGDRSGGKGRNNMAFGGGKKGRNMEFGGGKKGVKNRQYKDSKFGHGGPKRMRKQNTADSAADVAGFSGNRKNNNKKRRMN